MTLFHRTLAYRQEQEDAREAPHAAWCIGRTLRALDRLGEALDLQRGLLEQGAALNEEFRREVCQEIGECLLALGRREEALPYYFRAFDPPAHDA